MSAVPAADAKNVKLEKGGSNGADADKIDGSARVTENPAGEPDKNERETLHRGLGSRQIAMIAIGGAVGTGLIIGSGTALQRGGPLGMVLAYSIMGMICYIVMCGLGEMATFNPHRKGFAGYATRYVDPALGIATGYNYLFKYLIVTPNNVAATATVLQYWPGGRSVNAGVWIAIFMIGILIINAAGIRFFGEIEFYLSLVKIITLIGLLIMSICLTSGANPAGDVVWFRYWGGDSGPFSEYKTTGATGAFLGVWACMVNALFAYMGTELIGVTVGECANPRRNIPSAIRKTFWRILVFYIGGVFCITLLVASDDPDVFVASKASTSAAASPFVVAVRQFNIRALPSIINAAIMLFTLSAANSDLYIASRTLFGLAEDGYAPKFLLRVNKLGSPYYCLLITWLFNALAFLRVSSSGSVVFGYFVNLVTLFGGLTWLSILFCHIRFVKGMKVQENMQQVNGVPKDATAVLSRDTLRYKSPFGIVGSWIAFVVTAIVCFFKGFDSFFPTFSVSGFFTNYVGIVAFVGIYGYHKLRHHTKMVRYDEMDFVTGKAEIDEDEAYWLRKAEERGPLNFWQRLADKII